MTTTIQRKSPTIFPYRGKWRIQYVDLTGRSRTKTAETKQDAYRELVRLEQQMALGFLDRPAREVPTLAEWLETWIATRQGEVRISTHLGFESTIRLHIKPFLGHKKIGDIRVGDVEGVYISLGRSNGLSPATIRKVHAVLSQSFAMALRYGYVARNPMAEVRLPQVRTKPKKVLTAAEVRRVLDTASALPGDPYPRFLLALRLGMRQGECLALTWDDVDLDARVVRVTKSVDVIPGRGVVVSPPKSSQSYRQVPMDSETHQAFAGLRSGQSRSVKGDSLVFPSLRGTYRNARVDYDSWQRLLSQSGVRQVKLHDARHAAATLMLESGADARSIQLLLGHSSPGFTLATYVHPRHEGLRDVLERAADLGRA
jgi:integrase